MYDTKLNIDEDKKIQAMANTQLNRIFDTVILDFAYSERDMRVGVVMRDYTLCFWDYRESFQF